MLHLSLFLLNPKYYQKEIRVWIIASHFRNCEANSSYCDCKVVNNTKKYGGVFSKGKFNSSLLYFVTFPRYIHILFIHCVLLSMKVLLMYPKLHGKMKKVLLNSLKKLAYLLRSAFHTITRILEIWSNTSILYYISTFQTCFWLNAGDWKLVPGSFMILLKRQYREIWPFFMVDIFHF